VAKFNDKNSKLTLVVDGDAWPSCFWLKGSWLPGATNVGFLKGYLVVQVSFAVTTARCCSDTLSPQMFKLIWFGPMATREVKDGWRTPKSGNYKLLGLDRITPASIAYAATQVSIHRRQSHRTLLTLSQLHFALNPVARWDTETIDSNVIKLYDSLIDWFYDPALKSTSNQLLEWWERYDTIEYSICHCTNFLCRQIFPEGCNAKAAVHRPRNVAHEEMRAEVIAQQEREQASMNS
jgi:hypothetical protein